ncbi:MAG: metallophosphoesterase [Halieaceae bacterium]|jgi:hypothetical protein|nr:metallophosphoesterase [Halieaceae bacterium]
MGLNDRPISPRAAGLRVSLTQIASAIALAFVLATGCAVALAAAPDDDWQGVKRIVAVADVHGDYDNYIRVLEEAGVINRRGRWSAGETHFVQLGDVPDRGADTDRIIAHLRKLEEQARRDGGRVHLLIGNHEAMNISGDLRYVHAGEYRALQTRRSAALRDAYFEQVREYVEGLDDGPEVDEAWRDKWFEEHPLGYVEHRQHWHPSGEFGSWVIEHNAVLRINRTLFVHGGLSPAVLHLSIREINEQVREELASEAREGLIVAEDGPLWYRGLADNNETEEMAAHVQALLDTYDADRIVVGHTPGFGTIIPRYDARVLAADSGIGAYYGSHLASLLIEGDRLFTVHQGERVELPASDEGRVDYLKAIDAIEPGINNLQALIRSLEATPVEATPAAEQKQTAPEG